ncbi:MAG: PilZ domain-containing protein [Thermoanaerobaculia bacterium]
MKYPFATQFLVCTGARCNNAIRGDERGEKIRESLKERNRAEGRKGTVRVCSVSCLDLCDYGPNMIVWPAGTVYSHLDREKALRVYEATLDGGPPVTELELTPEENLDREAKKKAPKIRAGTRSTSEKELTSVMKDERRKAERFPLGLRIEFEGGAGLTRDVSGLGVMFETDSPFFVGDEIEFTMIIPEAVNVECRGRVVRVEDREGRFGVAATIDVYRLSDESMIDDARVPHVIIRQLREIHDENESPSAGE